MIGRLLRLVAVVVFAGWFLVLRPQVLGGSAGWILVAGESMEPTIRPGSLVIVMRRSDYQVGDVVAYRVPDGDPGAGANVIHRIVGGTADTGFATRGDNTNGPDLWRPRPDEIVGAAWLTVSDAVAVILFLRSPILVASVAAALATYWILGVLAPPSPAPAGTTRPVRVRRPRGVRPAWSRVR
jgi:signal peptidase I